MTKTAQPAKGNGDSGNIVLSIDAMGGDKGPAMVMSGLHKALQRNARLRFLVHGDSAVLEPLAAKHRLLRERCEIRHAADVVTMDSKPSHVMRHGKGTSMWAAVDAVRDGEARACVSCGNTGALMALSMIRLRKLPGVNRPAIACLWPSRNPAGFNVMLDVGADIRAEAEDLVQYALMGAFYAQIALELEKPRIGLLNVGTEEHKGRAELKVAHDMLLEAAQSGLFEYVGYVEGGDIPSARTDVIVTDGFTGNIALKTGEGTARLVSDLLKQAFRHSILSRLASLLALTSLLRLRRRIDPRRVNGGVFLGLNGTVVKSHGSSDATGIEAAVRLAHELARADLPGQLAHRVASVEEARQGAAQVGQLYGNQK
ncbi:phosphate acyltransferase PlsX [Mangrovicoccus algicola]|uniref:Phosphate acyltransferase n=1 Tax=Mangrovicoccus algicola TaxID=2771008 RepID=A0A8J6Z672_9RHOB|nr:phosphate acyltransferase PlsX [Mangrovicoccus algicola]MBE3637145.1 phosphate acyltransferase PlsX [Mangrovicoccus algicola]